MQLLDNNHLFILNLHVLFCVCRLHSYLHIIISMASSSSISKVKRKAANENKYVSNRPNLATEKHVLGKLVVKLKDPGSLGNSKSKCWDYFGYLTDTNTGKVLDHNNYYCKVCLEKCQNSAPQEAQALFQVHHSNKIKCYSLQTSTNNLTTHLVVAHKLEHCEDVKVNVIVITKYLSAYGKDVMAVSQHAQEKN